MERYYPIEGTEFELEIRTSYQLGGTNWGTGQREARGIYICFDTVKREPGVITRQLYGSLAGDNIKTGKVLAKELKRKSQKQIDLIDENYDFDGMAKSWLDGDYQFVLDYIFSKDK